MKNFPHQINQLPRLRDALEVFVRLADAQENVNDDGVVGDALARAGVYTFRNAGSRSADELLRAEHRKATASQGTRACARDLRRFFTLLGFINEVNQGWRVEAPARALLAFDQDTEIAQIHDLWRQALLNLDLADGHGSSHPYQILLRLVAEVPGLAKPYSGLCLEAADDTDAEFERIREIAGQDHPSETMEELAGAHMARNSIKILPSIAEQLRDVIERNGRLYVSDRIADALNFPPRGGGRPGGVGALIRRPFVPRRRTTGGQRREQGTSEPTTRLYDADLVAGRYNDHEDCLDRLSRLMPENVEQLRASYDLILVTPKHIVLVECKTIQNDARLQVRSAFGQLHYYEYFDVSPLYPNREIRRLVLTDSELPRVLREFLTNYRIGHIWIDKDGEKGGTDLGLSYLRDLGADC
jgi:hypothetical protein